MDGGGYFQARQRNEVFGGWKKESEKDLVARASTWKPDETRQTMETAGGEKEHQTRWRQLKRREKWTTADAVDPVKAGAGLFWADGGWMMAHTG